MMEDAKEKEKKVCQTDLYLNPCINTYERLHYRWYW